MKQFENLELNILLHCIELYCIVVFEWNESVRNWFNTNNRINMFADNLRNKRTNENKKCRTQCNRRNIDV